MVKQFQQVRDHPEVRSYDVKKNLMTIFSIDTQVLSHRVLVHVRFVDTISEQVITGRLSKINSQLWFN